MRWFWVDYTFAYWVSIQHQFIYLRICEYRAVSLFFCDFDLRHKIVL